MYILYCLYIWAFLYFFPGLALMPSLINSARSAFALPIVSAFIVYVLSSCLIQLHYFNTTTVTVSVITLGLIATIRLYKMLQANPLAWSSIDKRLYLIHAILLFPYFIKLGTHGFSRGDEIYSWNFWAIQHFFNEAIDFSHTGAPYPQLFPKLLATSYQLLNNIEFQLPVKATLIVFPWAMLTAIATLLRRLLPNNGVVYATLLAYVLWGVGLAQFFDDGYADPIMTSALIVSAVLFWHSQKTESTRCFYFAGLAVLAAWIAAHAKQAGLLWTGFSLPLLFLLAYRHKKEKRYFILAGLSMLGALVWILGEGSQFQNNGGVLWLSQGTRSVLEQLWYSVDQYFIHQPLLLGLFILTIGATRQSALLRQMLVLFFIPSWLCWFFFGAYQLRLGQHLIAFALFMIAASDCSFPTLLRLNQFVMAHSRRVWWAGVSVSVLLGSALFIKEVYIVKGGVSLYEGGRQSLHRYFGKEVDTIYHTVYSDPHALLWVPSRYIYGLFYKHTQLTTPDYKRYKEYDTAALVHELQRKMPNYVFTVSPAIIDGPASECLSNVIAQCPNAFEKISGPDNRFNFITYKVDKILLERDPCLNRFQASTRLSLAPENEGDSSGS